MELDDHILSLSLVNISSSISLGKSECQGKPNFFFFFFFKQMKNKYLKHNEKLYFSFYKTLETIIFCAAHRRVHIKYWQMLKPLRCCFLTSINWWMYSAPAHTIFSHMPASQFLQQVCKERS